MLVTTAMIRRVLAAALAALALWIAVDLRLSPGDPARFDGPAVGRMEARMWRSYYDRDRLALFLQLARNLREQFGAPFWQSHIAAFRAARAAFTFKQGRARGDYERALPDLEAYFARILPGKDSAKLATVELEWWIVHRERSSHPEGALQNSLVDLAAETYGLPREALAEHAQLRTEAMLIRDERAEHGGMTAWDWARIEELLVQSWGSLRRALGR